MLSYRLNYLFISCESYWCRPPKFIAGLFRVALKLLFEFKLEAERDRILLLVIRWLFWVFSTLWAFLIFKLTSLLRVPFWFENVVVVGTFIFLNEFLWGKSECRPCEVICGVWLFYTFWFAPRGCEANFRFLCYRTNNFLSFSKPKSCL